MIDDVFMHHFQLFLLICACLHINALHRRLIHNKINNLKKVVTCEHTKNVQYVATFLLFKKFKLDPNNCNYIYNL
jgi:hypothetical protein